MAYGIRLVVSIVQAVASKFPSKLSMRSKCQCKAALQEWARTFIIYGRGYAMRWPHGMRNEAGTTPRTCVVNWAGRTGSSVRVKRERQRGEKVRMLYMRGFVDI